MTFNLWAKTQARRLHAAGYRGVSNRHRIVSRVDRDIGAWAAEQGGSYFFLLNMGKACREDWYRRCISNDTHKVSAAVYKALKTLA